MRRWLALVLALLALAPPAHAQEAPVLLATPERGDLATVFSLAPDRPLPALGQDVLRNGDFSLGTTFWTYGTELAGRTAARVVVENGSKFVSLDALAASKDGSVLVKQQRPLAGARAYALSFDARNAGDPVDYAIILREEGFSPAANNVTRATWDTTFRGTLRETWASYGHRWEPRFPDSTQVTLMLRFLATRGETATVSFDNASLVPLGSTRWETAGGVGATGPDGATLRFETRGEKRVVLDHVAPTGERTRLERTLVVENAPHALRVEPIAGAVVGAPVRLRAMVEDPDAPAAIAESGFDQGMGAWRAIAAAPARAEPEGGALVLRVADGEAALAHAPLAGEAGAPARFLVTYRDEGDVRHAWVVRERRGNETLDTPLQVPRSDAWRTLDVTWTPRLEGAERASLVLQALPTTGEGSGAAFIDEVRATRLPRVRWEVAGALEAEGMLATWTPTRAGTRALRAVALDAQGQEATWEGAVEVAPAPLRVELVAPEAVSAGTAYVLRAQLSSRGAPVADADVTWALDGAPLAGAGAQRTLALEPGAHVVEARARAEDFEDAAARFLAVVVEPPSLQADGERAWLRWTPTPGAGASYAWRPAGLDDALPLRADEEAGEAPLSLTLAAEGGTFEVEFPGGARIDHAVAPLSTEALDAASPPPAPAPRDVPSGWPFAVAALALAGVLVRRR